MSLVVHAARSVEDPQADAERRGGLRCIRVFCSPARLPPRRRSSSGLCSGRDVTEIRLAERNTGSDVSW